MFISKIKFALALLAMTLVVPATAYATHTWSDVPTEKFYHDAVEWAEANGMTTGCNEGTAFCPENNVTRGENITFAKRYDDFVVQPALADIQDQIDDNVGDIANLPDVYFAEIDTDGTVLRSSFGVSTSGGGDGQMDVDFPTDITDCVWQGTVAQKYVFGGNDDNNGEVSLGSDIDFNGFAFVVDVDSMFVETRDSSGTIKEMPVHIVVTCGLQTGIFIPPILPPIILFP